MTIGEIFTARMPSARQWIAGAILFLSYFAASVFGAHIFTPPAVISAATGIALAGLVLEGVTLWPALYLGALAAYVFDHAGALQLFIFIIVPAAQTAQAIVGALLLKKLRLDPMLDHVRDGLIIFFVGIGASAITPACGMVAYSLNRYFFSTPIPALTFGSWWGGSVMSVIVITPFLIQWLLRPIFSRTRKELREIVIVFGSLIGISLLLFFTSIDQIGDISLVYFLLIPLFWIAIRLGPRFMTLSIVLVAILGLWGTFLRSTTLTSVTLGNEIFQVEMLLITLAGIFLVIVSSVEERKEALKNLQSHLIQLENEFGAVSDRDRTKSQFLAILAHELRNPLAPLVSSLEMLRIKGSIATEDLPVLDDMEERIKTIRRLLDDILDISRISQNKLHLQKEYVELQGVVVHAVHSVENKLEEREQTIAVNIRKEPIRLNVDKVRIEQVITNLLVNASKFTERKGNISISVQQQGGIAEVRIKDDGIGIDPTMLTQIFEPFLQVEGRRKNDGLGIGLSLSKQLVEMHEGTIEAKSKGHGHGSEFIVRLPMLAFSEQAEGITRVHSPLSLGKISGTHRVLIVDDNTAAAQGIGRLLVLMGYSVEYASSSAEAVRQAKRWSPDSIILDIGLPDVDGYETAHILRKKLIFKGELIALTGYGQAEDKKKAYEAGFDHHLTKPVSIVDLQSLLHISPRH